MAFFLKERHDIEISTSDHNPIYEHFLISKRHVSTKAETALVECYNSLLRHYLARFHRRTKRYSKSIDMIEHSIHLLFNYLGRTHLKSILC